MATGRSPWVGDHGSPPAGGLVVPQPAVVESLVLTMPDGQSVPACIAATLKGFDQIRRQVAMRIAGQDGIFVGYDPMELFITTSPPSSTVLLVGSIIDVPSARRHRVRYTAYSVIRDRSGSAPSAHLLVVHAVGITLTPHAAASGTTGAAVPT